MSASFLRELQQQSQRIAELGRTVAELQRIVAQLQARPKPGRPPKSQ